MKKLFRLFGKLIAGILVLVFIASAFASIFMLAFNTRLFDSDFYLSAFEEVGLFDRLPSIAATQITFAMEFNPCEEDPTECDNDGTNQAEPPSYFQALSEKDWELLLGGLLPPEWLEDQVLEITGGIFDSIDQGYGDIEIKISLKDLKELLSGEEGIQAIVKLLDTQPECSKDDLLDMTRVLQGKEKPGGDFLNCRPPDDFIKNYTPQLEVLLRRSLRDVPDEIDLGSRIFGDEGTSKNATIKIFGVKLPIFSFVKWIRWLITMSPLACLLLLIIIAFLGVYSYKGLSGWWGYPLAISGFLGLTVSLLVGPVVNFLTDRFLKDRVFLGISQVLIDTGTDLAVEIIRSLFIQVRNFSLIVIGMGLAVIVTAVVLKTPKGTDQGEAGDEDQEEDIPEIPDPDSTAEDDATEPDESEEEIEFEEKEAQEDSEESEGEEESDVD